ncbi:O-linked N-acetylglucosamine transferase, SPINDLY family protein [Chitinilyticum litopenaei]|uniref:O-linked N-acetylglucosamine transferase, SPINDLY family protein n=1 Tax=Chitinilyticum litopenaei TaxID=1121276 RepID=UPI001184BFCC|nr:hypothetical protein [Chitinilyticum litopenaei]
MDDINHILHKFASALHEGFPDLVITDFLTLSDDLKDKPQVRWWYAHALKQCSLHGEAAALFHELSVHDEITADCFFYEGYCHWRLGNTSFAVELTKKSLAWNPGHSKAHFNLCVFYREIENYQLALPHAKWILENGTEPQELLLAGEVFKVCWDLDNSYLAACRAIEIDPQSLDTQIGAHFSICLACDWKRSEAISQKLMACYLAGKYDVGESLLSNVTWCMDESINFEVARHAARKIPTPIVLYSSSRIRRPGRLRIGYVSSDFYEHATLSLIVGVFEKHDRNNFEVFVYDHGRDDQSLYRQRLRCGVEHFVDIRSLDDAEAARMINSDGIDILVDLKGQTQGARLGIFAFRPAPVSVTYLGFPGTSGANFIDYLIGDHIVVPDASRKFYSEKVCRLPWSYQCNDDKRLIDSGKVNRSDFGLPENGFVFCCFNRSSKIELHSFTFWMKILAASPGSVLWLLDAGPVAERNLRREAGNLGVDGERLIFADNAPAPLHLARLALADLALDTRIFNGHTTTSDALWAGVPLLTVVGEHFASRVSASLLTALGLQDLIFQNWEALCAEAIDLAENKEKSLRLRNRVAEARETFPLFDTKRFTKDLEMAFVMMAERAEAGLLPDHIDVPLPPPENPTNPSV